MKQPQIYEEWLLAKDEQGELGAKMLVTSAILRDGHKEILNKAFEIVRDAFTKKLFEDGTKPLRIELFREYDASLGGWEIMSALETQHGATLEEFAGHIYADAASFYCQLENWKHKSLWQYIKWAFKRRFGGK